MNCIIEALNDDLAGRIAVARAIGLLDENVNEIKIIDGVPEWWPPQRLIVRSQVRPEEDNSVGC